MNTALPFDPFDLSTWEGKRFALIDHSDSSYFGRGPWALAPGETGKSPNGGACAVKLIPADDDSFTYAPSILVWPSDAARFIAPIVKEN